MSTSETTTTEQSRRAVTDLLAARDAGDAERVNELLTEDAEFYGPLSLMTEPRRGREAVAKQLLSAGHGLFEMSTLRRTYHHVAADGDKVAVRQSTRATTLKGPIYENEYVFWYETRGGQVCRIEEHADSLAAARTLGLL